MLVFHVTLGPGARHAGQVFGLIACDGFLGGFSRVQGAASSCEVAPNAAIFLDALVRKTLARSDSERDSTALSDFGLSPIDGRGTPDGTGTGDLAIHLAEEWERTSPSPVPGTRLDRVRALQARLLAEGLGTMVDAIGRERMHLHALLLSHPMNVLDPHLGCLSMPGASAIRLHESTQAYPALAVGIASTWRSLAGGATPHRTALAHMEQSGVDASRGRAILRSISGPDGPAAVHRCTLQVLARVPRDWVPAPGDRAGWDALSRLSPVLLMAADTTGQPVEELVAHCGGRWLAYAERLAAAAGVSMEARADLSFGHIYGELRDAGNDIGDMMRDLSATLAAPLLTWRFAPGRIDPEYPPGDLVRRLLFEGRGLARILEASARWHRAGGVRIAGRETGSVSWDPVLPPMRHGAVEVVPIASKSDLADEGASNLDAGEIAGLRHCVASRWSECIMGRSRIMGVRRIADGTRLSTFEVSFDEAFRPTLKEHRGHANGPPPREAVLAVTGYMTLIATGHIPFDAAPLAQGRRRRNAESAEDLCGYDWRDSDRLAEAIDAWSPYIARPYRNLGPGAFLNATMGLNAAEDLGPPAPAL